VKHSLVDEGEMALMERGGIEKTLPD